MSGSDCKVYYLTCIGEGVADVIFLTCRGQVVALSIHISPVYCLTCIDEGVTVIVFFTCRGQVVSIGYLSQLEGSPQNHLSYLD